MKSTEGEWTGTQDENSARLTKIETTQNFIIKRIEKIENDIEHIEKALNELYSSVSTIKANLKWITALILITLSATFGVNLVL